MIWWTLDDDRLTQEKASLTTLEESSEWLSVGEWYIADGLQMAVDFTITHQDKPYRLQLMYPAIFPSTPPMVFTFGLRLSDHQYGANGELCLEYRPDNWHPEVTGAMMVSSAHTLIASERPENGERSHALSAHESSVATEARSSWCRFLVSSHDLNAFNSLAVNIVSPLTLNINISDRTLVASVMCIGESTSTDVVYGTIPVSCTSFERPATIIRTQNIPATANAEQESLEKHLSALGLEAESQRLFENNDFQYLVFGDGNKWNLYGLSGAINARKVHLFKVIEISEAAKRLPTTHQSLANRQIAIVGCGSMGSKVAASLVRSGVNKLLLIDEDIFYPENIVRNELDLTGIGLHKVDALKDHLLNLNPKADIVCVRFSFGGQESSNLLSAITDQLARTDLIVDETASVSVFNHLASVSTREKVPLVWSQVFAGGIGGFVARARPGLDPPPLEARQQINAWCENENVEWDSVTKDTQYQTTSRAGDILIADDADISVIAGHTTRFVIDHLTRPHCSHFSSSAYMIGLSNDWIFEAPFDTAPISLTCIGNWGIETPLLPNEEINRIIKSHARKVD